MNLQSSGHVLGIDVGFSLKSKSSAACRLSWRDKKFCWAIERYRSHPIERRETITRVVADFPIAVVALDGPIRGDLREIGVYRTAEKMLTVGLRPHIGKPGQSSAPVGRRLNMATNEAAQCVMDLNILSNADHKKQIHRKAIVEAFPTSFMGLMIENSATISGNRDKRSDRFFEYLAASKGFNKLLSRLIPGAQFENDPSTIRNHDDRAAFVCSLTALCVAVGSYSAVGDDHGWIILPPRDLIVSPLIDIIEKNSAQIGTDCFYCEN